ncbi:MAG: hypothetical protein H6Q78_1354, partial [Candidatus Krumholzibacteriota bacterium]|nr:hypothetical protein [Candidatus Krumholzibacteriota bacterium]
MVRLDGAGSGALVEIRKLDKKY